MIRPTLIDLNLVELNYYPFRFSCYKCNGSCNALYAFRNKQKTQIFRPLI